MLVGCRWRDTKNSDKIMENSTKYSEWIIKIIKENVHSYNNALDIFSNINYRHAEIIKNCFKNIDAVDQRFPESGKIGNISLIKGKADKIQYKDEYDIILFAWPEMLFYKYFFDEIVKIRNRLSKDGKIIFIYKENKIEKADDEFTLLLEKLMLIDDEQPVCHENEVKKIFEDNNFQIDNEYQIYLEDYKEIEPAKINFTMINDYNNGEFTEAEKARIKELSQMITTKNTGWIKALVFENGNCN
jgi:hypothetical protein